MRSFGCARSPQPRPESPVLAALSSPRPLPPHHQQHQHQQPVATARSHTSSATTPRKRPRDHFTGASGQVATWQPSSVSNARSDLTVLASSEKENRREDDNTQPVQREQHKEVLEQEEEKDECCICLGEIGQVLGCLTCCEHKFCFACISQWAEKSNTCPLCKQRFREIIKKSVGGHGRKKQRTERVRVRRKDYNPWSEEEDDDDDDEDDDDDDNTDGEGHHFVWPPAGQFLMDSFSVGPVRAPTSAYSNIRHQNFHQHPHGYPHYAHHSRMLQPMLFRSHAALSFGPVLEMLRVPASFLDHSRMGAHHFAAAFPFSSSSSSSSVSSSSGDETSEPPSPPEVILLDSDDDGESIALAGGRVATQQPRAAHHDTRPPPEPHEIIDLTALSDSEDGDEQWRRPGPAVAVAPPVIDVDIDVPSFQPASHHDGVFFGGPAGPLPLPLPVPSVMPQQQARHGGQLAYFLSSSSSNSPTHGGNGHRSGVHHHHHHHYSHRGV